MAPSPGDAAVWTGLCRKIQPGNTLNCPAGLKAECLARNPDGSFTFRFSSPVDEAYLAANGAVPLPQYILNARKRRGAAAPADEDKYQTVYAAEAGSIAAHTAGFHFTPDLFVRLERAGVKKAFVTLHIGWGTFRPVRSEDPAAHVMMEESCWVPEGTAAAINAHKAAGGRVIAVGTSSMRTLETFSDEKGTVLPGAGKAGLFIRPGYRFKVAGAFITNLHVPESAPLYMTAAFAGRELLFKAYSEAVKEKYRFYSYGDSMFVS
jgi:S-adenosylmethionine:tRNA ribosyltransferase-isomerase